MPHQRFQGFDYIGNLKRTSNQIFVYVGLSVRIQSLSIVKLCNPSERDLGIKSGTSENCEDRDKSHFISNNFVVDLITLMRIPLGKAVQSHSLVLLKHEKGAYRYTKTSLVRNARDRDVSYKLAEVRTININENIDRKGEIEQFLLYPQCFPFLLYR